MKHRLLVAVALAALVCAAIASSAAAGRGDHAKGQLLLFRGEVVSASTSSLQVTVEGGNRAALRSILGQSQNQTFTLGSTTQILVWSNGVPTVGTAADLKAGDWVQVAERVAGTALTVADRGAKPSNPSKPLFLFRGTVSGPQSGGQIALHVTGGNHLALKLLLGQSADQTFTYDSNTIFLLWQGKTPTVIDPSKLVAGDRITVRIRAPHNSTLAQVESTAAVHVGDHEPANAPDHS